MSIFSALDVGITGLQAQTNAINVISNNISNAGTTGFKSGTATFADLLANGVPSNDSPSGYAPGGVMSGVTQLNDSEGAVTASNSATDIAISGVGLFTVSPTPTSSADELVYTRAGSFSPDANGNYANAAGYYLQAWPLNPDGSLPAALSGPDVSSATAIAALQPVNIQQIAPTPVPTSTASIQANLTSSQAVYAGSPPYDPANPAANMASGAIQPDFIVPVVVVDSTGATHELDSGFLKTGSNSWSVEVYAKYPGDVTAPSGQLAAGTVTFNGDGTLASISPSIAQAIPVTWTGSGTAPSSITFNWGTAGAVFGTPGATAIGRTDGLEQLDGAYNLQNVQQNGIQAGTTAIPSISANGVISVSYSDDTSRALYQIPLAQFQNPDVLQAESANIFAPTAAAGAYSFFSPGGGNAATIDPNSLESSNVDVASQLTTLIVAQNAYQSNSQLISVSNQMMQTLTGMDVAVPD